MLGKKINARITLYFYATVMAPKHIFFTIDLGYREFPVTYRSYLKVS